jgi:hypothetical protein
VVSYCDESDLYDFGLPRGSLSNPARPVTADAATNSFTLDVHGFVDDAEVSLRADPGGSLPTGLAAGVTYFAKRLSEYAFQVAATSGGAAIDFTTAGSRVVAYAPINLAAAIQWASRVLDDAMQGSTVVPLALPVPEIIQMTCAELAAGKLMAGRNGSRALSEVVDAATRRAAKWAKVRPQGENAKPPAGLAVSATAPYCDRRGWNRFGGIS